MTRRLRAHLHAASPDDVDRLVLSAATCVRLQEDCCTRVLFLKLSVMVLDHSSGSRRRRRRRSRQGNSHVQHGNGYRGTPWSSEPGLRLRDCGGIGDPGGSGGDKLDFAHCTGRRAEGV